MSAEHSSSASFSSEEEDEFFDAKSTDDEKDVSPETNVDEEHEENIVAVGDPQLLKTSGESDTQNEQGFALPVPPPRRKKKVNVGQSSVAVNECSIDTKVPPSANLTKLVDDIVSIQGNLSVSDAVLAQSDERRSVLVEEFLLQSDDKKLVEKEETESNSKSDTEILEQIMLKNKDTGECVPLSQADKFLPKCLNPLNDHLMRLTSNYESDDEEENEENQNSEVTEIPESIESLQADLDTNTISRRQQLKRRVKKFGHGIIKGVKGVRKESSTEPKILSNLELEAQNFFKFKVNRKKGVPDFEGLRVIQELTDCKGAIWCMKWSSCGKLLAVAGQDQLLRVYCSYKAWKYFTQLRSKASGQQQISPNSTKERSFSTSRSNSISSSDNLSVDCPSRIWMDDNTLSEEGPLLLFTAYSAHTADVLDISWSKNNFLLSSSMDKTVRLWHISRVECLCTFRHIDFVTTIQFHPRDDRYFLSGSLDGKLRLWNIPDKKVTLWNEVTALPVQGRRNNQASSPEHGLITSSAFVQNGKFAVIGTYDGRVIFYSTDQLKYSTQIHVSGKNLNNRGEVIDPSSTSNRKRNNNKVTGIEGVGDTKILVTTNDSRIRLYDLRDLSLACKYKGCVNFSSQIKASVSHDAKYIVCGSENCSFYIWRLQEHRTIGQRNDRNQQWECVKLFPGTHSTLQQIPGNANGNSRNMPGIVTAATFAPVPNVLDDNAKYIIAVADFSGIIKLFSKNFDV